MSIQTIEKGVQMYHAQKAENEIDLVDSVRQTLVNAGLKNLVEMNFDTNRFILEAQGKGADVQRFLLNRYWTAQLMNAPADSLDQRVALVPNGDVRDWLVLFNERILPFVLEHNLPMAV